MIIVDGQEYENINDVPDFGSIECIADKGRKRSYQLMSVDVSKLPTYVSAGSTAMCLDTGDTYCFHEKTKTWIKLN